MRHVAVLAVTLALAGAAGAGTVRSGLYGTVLRGPTAPVCAAEQSCTAPAAGAVLTFVRNGVAAGHVTVAADGSYRLRLPPGLYAVRVGKRIEPATVRVVPLRMRRVAFMIDTGIR
ncbi:MAG TPA: hypothetical protein VGH92_07915 [Gaiellaceae bacterium]|jgi:hypothetical protein